MKKKLKLNGTKILLCVQLKFFLSKFLELGDHTSGFAKVLVCLELFSRIHNIFSKNLSTSNIFIQQNEM